VAIVETHDLTKKFNGRKAVNRLNLPIEDEEIFGLLASNGARTKTAIGLISTILYQTGGTATIGGYDIRGQPKEVRQIIGVVPQEVSLYDNLTAAENIEYFGKLHGMKGKRLHNRVNKLLKLIQLQDRANDRVKTFSSGMKDRLNLAVSLVHAPRVLFLDEPTTGLDPQARLAVWKMIQQLRAGGITILLTTHYMEEADYLCDRVAIMNNGKIIALGSPEELKRSIGKLEIIKVKATGIPNALLSKLRKLKGTKKVVRTSEGLRILTPTADALLGRIVSLITSGGVSIDSLDVVHPTLEDVFIKLTGRVLRD